MTRKEEYQERRQKLCQLSADFRKYREKMAAEARTDAEAMRWLSRTLNSFIVEYYKNELGAGDFNTFHQWKEKGKTIKKGEKGWPIWAQPLGHRPEDTEPTEDDYLYFPMCYLFHESQTVVKKEIAAT
jgi:hypothetical protein